MPLRLVFCFDFGFVGMGGMKEKRGKDWPNCRKFNVEGAGISLVRHRKFNFDSTKKPVNRITYKAH